MSVARKGFGAEAWENFGGIWLGVIDGWGASGNAIGMLDSGGICEIGECPPPPADAPLTNAANAAAKASIIGLGTFPGTIAAIMPIICCGVTLVGIGFSGESADKSTACAPSSYK